ncbi:MAG: hypothetical protein QXH67_04660 [Candidatus Bathyarchaeia archaeon]
MKSKNLDRVKWYKGRSKRTKRVFKERRGQFVVAAALLISIITLSIALSVHKLSLHRLQLRYEPVEELVMGISSDLDRCLTYALHNATELYYNLTSSGNNHSIAHEEAKNEALRFISKWASSIITSYSPVGLMIMMKTNTTNEGGKINIDFKIDWDNEYSGMSYIYTDFQLDIESYGFKGWVDHSGKYVKLYIDNSSLIITREEISLVFKLVQGKNEVSIPNLTNYSVKLLNSDYSKELCNATELKYLGKGFYNVSFPYRMNKSELLRILVITPLDHIYVSALLFCQIEEEPQEEFGLYLSSRERTNKTKYLGMIFLNSTGYSLPNGTTIQDVPSSYSIKYVPNNSDEFLFWEYTGNVSLTLNYDINENEIIVTGNGSLTAVYYRPSEWDTLYLDLYRNNTGLLNQSLPDDSKFIESKFSWGNEKQTFTFTSQEAPYIKLGDPIIIYLYTRTTPPNSIKYIDLYLGYWLNDTYTPILEKPSYTYIKDQGLCYFSASPLIKEVPEGSIIVLDLTIEFIVPPSGHFFLYYGLEWGLSRIELF